LPPANFRLAKPDELRAMFRELPQEIARAGIFLAGCGTEGDRQLLTRLCAEVWPSAKIVVGSDRDSGLAAALGNGDGIVVNAGSGSSVTGRRDKKIENAGGWGHILGDAGGGYFLSIQALRLILREYDLRRGEVQFASKILHALSLNNLDELVRWAQDHGCHKVSLQVWPHNDAALRLYEKFGFEREGLLRSHYRRRNGELWDAIVMGLLLR
jgi:N-acetylglucosamine kinase-like BadF-type ATPase